jgi:hypothetical protein
MPAILAKAYFRNSLPNLECIGRKKRLERGCAKSRKGSDGRPRGLDVDSHFHVYRVLNLSIIFLLYFQFKSFISLLLSTQI